VRLVEINLTAFVPAGSLSVRKDMREESVNPAITYIYDLAKRSTYPSGDGEYVPNIFRSLVQELPEVRQQTHGIRQLTECAMAARLLALFFGYDWYQQKVAFRDDPDEWMHNRKGDTSTNRILNHRRVIQLGDCIFTLLKGQFKGGDVLRNRFLTRQTKPCYIETEIASLLAYNGMQVEVIGESGTRGEDFDLAATKDDVTVSVEITAKEAGPLTVQTLTNTLKSKRTQVPNNRPAVLYIRVPAEWDPSLPANHAIFHRAFNDFCRGSRRINAIVLVWEEVLGFMGGAFTPMTMWACHNNNPRHPYPVEHFFLPRATPDGEVLLAHSFLDFLEKLEAEKHNSL
jgi:hypothetical protein